MPARACEYQDIRRAFCWPTSVPKTSWQHSAAVSAAPLIILLVQLHCWEVFTASQLRSFVRPKGRKSPSSAGNTSRRRPYLEPGVEGQMTSASSLSYGIRHAVGVTERETERERERETGDFGRSRSPEISEHLGSQCPSLAARWPPRRVGTLLQPAGLQARRQSKQRERQRVHWFTLRKMLQFTNTRNHLQHTFCAPYWWASCARSRASVRPECPRMR